ncbi:hypothetical protein MHX62_10180 [Corynebacterium sp. ACRQM]|jgi:putative adenine phosphoribosyltransferase|uniref:phosphoribosyltransferase family protein n=1 Tax=unclassified Corynebacterium TaxID=2624378 RepID=UPI001EF590FB|nr:phosphoribosyltransferase family protein [Corynebacterium sp. ACRPR]MCG7234469.1 hypothetical protein [Corynebacterium sp. ACRPR]MCG7272424.1 hypothetical protein [Corynebacterium sp. ACRQM]
MNINNTYTIEVSGVKRDLPVVPVSEDVAIAFLKLYGDNDLLTASIDSLSRKLSSSVDLLVGAEAGGILVAYELSRQTGIPYVILRKKQRPNMDQPLTVEVNTIGTDKAQRLYLDDADQDTLKGKTVAFVDEVISSGATMEASCKLVRQAGGRVQQKLAVAIEGQKREDVDSVFAIPLFSRRDS